MSAPVTASPATLRVLSVAAFASAAVGVPLIAIGTQFMGAGIGRDVVLAIGFILAVVAIVLAVLGLILSTRTAIFIVALVVSAGWVVLAIVVLAVGAVGAR